MIRKRGGPGSSFSREQRRYRRSKMAAPETVAVLPGSGPEQQVTSNGTAAGAPTAETQQQNQPQQQAPNAWQVIKGVLFRIFIIWAISSWFRRGPAPQDQISTGGASRVPSRNLFPKDTLMDLHVYISEHEHFTDFNVTSALFWEQRDLVYGDWTSGENADGCYERYAELDIPESVQHNGSMYVHVYFTKSGFHPDPKQKNLYRRLATVHTSRMINKYKRRRFQKTKNLLTGETEADPEMIKRAEDFGPVEVISHWHPNLTINIVDDHTPWVKGSVPPPLDQYVKFDAVSGDYYPILYFNDYWNLQKDYFPINETVERLPFRLSFCPLSLWRWQLYAAQSTKSPWHFLGEDLYEQSDEEQDSVKVALLETNPYLLALTIVVSIVHSIFEFLAFKNDGVPVSLMDSLPLARLLCCVQLAVHGAQRLVLVGPEHALWLPSDIWFYYDDSAAVHKLQTEVSSPSALEDAHLQSTQHLHRRPLCLCDQNAHDVQDRLPPRRCRLLHLPLSALDLPGGSDACQRVRDKWGGPSPSANTRYHFGGLCPCTATRWGGNEHPGGDKGGPG
ncbi:cleft lip and palate transmembrane protein 1 isoform X3 [Chelonia mydas]|uniref:cleft lip and palate transmembrane protein 1 isoform X3 n=1 Tax=Chelonia mydas TaxID=8469 RepID=UPI001CA80D67|nr:cleft lip and palate transmembrane protein 1 isoform X3 [Chelonia mydas]